MEPELAARVASETVRLGTQRALSPGTLRTYRTDLTMWWEPYARRHHLPANFNAPAGRALTLDEVIAFVGAAASGELRAGTREPDPSKAGRPLSPASVEGLLAAMRWAHLIAGRTWVGQTHPTELRELRQGYRREHGTAAVPARPMQTGDIGVLFDAPPTQIGGDVLRAAVARALSVQAGMMLWEAGRLIPELVRIDEEEAIIRRRLRVPCLAVDSDDPLLSIVCAHCLLARWKVEAEPRTALFPTTDMLSSERTAVATLIERVPGASLRSDALQSPRGAASEAGVVALSLPGPGVDWMVARALLLPMRSVGLGFDDFVGSLDIQVDPSGVTLTRGGRQRSQVLIRPTGGPRCPVAAMVAYDSWARAFLPQREHFLVTLLGKGVRYPVERVAVEGTTARYQWLSKWLRNQQEQRPGADSSTGRFTLTTRSAQRGFAQAAHEAGHDEFTIRQALGHVRVGTTLRTLRVVPDAAGRVLNAIEMGRHDDE